MLATEITLARPQLPMPQHHAKPVPYKCSVHIKLRAEIFRPVCLGHSGGSQPIRNNDKRLFQPAHSSVRSITRQDHFLHVALPPTRAKNFGLSTIFMAPHPHMNIEAFPLRLAFAQSVLH